MVVNKVRYTCQLFHLIFLPLMGMLRSTQRHFKLCQDSKFAVPLPDALPSLSSIPNKNDNWKPPPQNDRVFFFFQVVCGQAMLHLAVHLESAVTTHAQILSMCL